MEIGYENTELLLRLLLVLKSGAITCLYQFQQIQRQYSFQWYNNIYENK